MRNKEYVVATSGNFERSIVYLGIGGNAKRPTVIAKVNGVNGEWSVTFADGSRATGFDREWKAVRYAIDANETSIHDGGDIDSFMLPGEDMDGDHASALASAGFGTDEDYGYFGGDDF